MTANPNQHWGGRNHTSVSRFLTSIVGLVDVINKKTMKDNKLTVLLRELVLQCLKNNILFRAVHVPGALNVKAYALSRLQVTKFKSLRQGMDHEQTLVPHLLGGVRTERFECRLFCFVVCSFYGINLLLYT